jgi:type I restriction modification DNA specificity protein
MDKMKDSGIKWIGLIPEGWQVVSIKSFLQKRKEILEKWTNENVLSLTMNGVVIRDLENPSGKMPATFDGYQKIYKGNLVLCLFDIDVTPRCVGIAYDDGVTSPAYSQYIIKEGDLRFYYYLLLMMDNDKILLQYSRTLRSTLTDEYFGAVKVAIPKSIIEQQRIAKFLDEKTALIDDIITDTKQTIEELKSYKQSLISEIVTKGINKNVKLVPSGIEWIGEVPEEWEVLKSRYFLNEISVKGYPDEEVLSLYRDYGIIPKNSRSDNHNVTSLDTSGYKLVKPGNLVINKMKAWQGSMAISNLRGIVSPAYYTFEVDNERFNLRFLHYALRNPAYKQEYMRISAGLRVGQWDLNKNEFKNIKYAFPANKEEQKAIADYLDEKSSQIDALIIEKENVISEYENYKKSMIYEYVTGKKRVEGYES